MRTLVIIALLYFGNCHALILDRVILATDSNNKYVQFWPSAAQAWQEIVGVRPTLAVIGKKEEIVVDETLGDVIYFEPIEGVPTSLYAQCIRILLPALFPNDVCIVSDIDLLPLQKKFFTKYIHKAAQDSFVIYRSRHYWWWKKRIYMNYVAAKGATFGEIFNVHKLEDIPHIIRLWYSLNIGWATDEMMLYRYVHTFEQQNKKRVKRLGFARSGHKRISRTKNCKYDEKKLKKGKYREFNCPRPYYDYKQKIDKIMQLACIAAAKKQQHK